MTGTSEDANASKCQRDPDRSRDLFGVQLEVINLFNPISFYFSVHFFTVKRYFTVFKYKI